MIGIVIALVAALAMVQSLFGVGLLVLGTPLLLLVGFGFESALWLLLPASLTVSALQLVVDGGIPRRDVRSIATTTVPAVLLGLLLTLRGPFPVAIEVPIAMMLLASIMIRLSPDLAARVRDACRAHERIVLASIALTHGITNMGGSLLPAFATSRYTDKLLIRQTIALTYLVFASTQLAALAAAGRETPGVLSLWLMVVAGAVFLTAGRLTLAAVAQRTYSRLIGTLMFGVAGVLLSRALRWW